MHVQSSIRGICSSPAAPAASYMAVQPGAGNLALLGSAGSLQFYDLLRQETTDLQHLEEADGTMAARTSRHAHSCILSSTRRDTHIDRLQLSYLGQARAAATAHPEAAAMLKTTHALFGADAEVGCHVQVPWAPVWNHAFDHDHQVHENTERTCATHFAPAQQVLITAEQTVDVGGVVSVVKRWLRSEVSTGHFCRCSHDRVSAAPTCAPHACPILLIHLGCCTAGAILWSVVHAGCHG